MNIGNITSTNHIIINGKIGDTFNPDFFMLLIAKSLEIFRRQNGYAFISVSFGLN